MKVSEKSLELNVGAEILDILRNRWGMSKAYLRGLTQREEKREGVDFFVHLPSQTRLFAFQFKAPKAGHESCPYRYTIRRDQHQLLRSLAQSVPNSVFYVFPFYLTIGKLQRDVPDLLQDTWLLDVSPMATRAVFGPHRTRTIACQQGVAFVNPEFALKRLSDNHEISEGGVSVEQFVSTYRKMLESRDARSLHKSPWLVRGLRLVIVPPAG